MATAPSSAALKSASSNTMNGALPPSSKESRVTCLAARSMIPLPTSVEPVKPILRMSGCVEELRRRRADERLVVSTLKTPARQAGHLGDTSAMASAVSGVAEAGLSTTVQPAARAGAILRVTIVAGKVPGRHRGDRPDRLVEHPVALARLRRRDPLAAQPPRLLGEPAEVAERELDFLLRLLEGLAVLLDDEAGDVVAPRLHPGPDAVEDDAAILGGHRRPAREGGRRGVHRQPRLGGAAVGDARRPPGPSRVAHLELRAAAGPDPLPVDVHPVERPH